MVSTCNGTILPIRDCTWDIASNHQQSFCVEPKGRAYTHSYLGFGSWCYLLRCIRFPNIPSLYPFPRFPTDHHSRRPTHTGTFSVLHGTFFPQPVRGAMSDVSVLAKVTAWVVYETFWTVNEDYRCVLDTPIDPIKSDVR